VDVAVTFRRMVSCPQLPGLHSETLPEKSEEKETMKEKKGREGGREGEGRRK